MNWRGNDEIHHFFQLFDALLRKESEVQKNPKGMKFIFNTYPSTFLAPIRKKNNQ